MKILVINGPNLNLLGEREPNIYGDESLKAINDELYAVAQNLGHEISFFQSNSEGSIIDSIHAARLEYDGIVLNAGAYTHYSYAIHDALASVTTIPKIEIHISDITKREGFRSNSVTKAACDGQIYGHGFAGYLEAIDEVIRLVQKK